MLPIPSSDFQKLIYQFQLKILKKIRKNIPLESNDLIFPDRTYDLNNKEFSIDQLSQILTLFSVLHEKINYSLIIFRLGQTPFTHPTSLLLLRKYDGLCQLEFNYFLSQEDFDQLNEIAPNTRIVTQVQSDCTKIINYRLKHHLFFLSSSHSEAQTPSSSISAHILTPHIEYMIQRLNTLAMLCTKQANAQARFLFSIGHTPATAKEANEALSEEHQEYLYIVQNLRNATEEGKINRFLCIISDFLAFKFSSLEKEKNKYLELRRKIPSDEHLQDLYQLILEEEQINCQLLQHIQENMISYSFQFTRALFNPSSLNLRSANSSTPLIMNVNIDWPRAMYYFCLPIYLYIQADITLPSYNYENPSFVFNQLLLLQKQSKIVLERELDKFEELETTYGFIYDALLELSDILFAYSNENSIHEDLIQNFVQIINESKFTEILSLLSRGLRTKGQDSLASYLEFIFEEILHCAPEQNMFLILEDMLFNPSSSAYTSKI